MTIRYALFWIAAACCVVAELVILRSLLFGRAREHERSASARPASRAAEVAWAIIPAVGLAFVLYLTWQAVDAAHTPPPAVSHSGVTIGA